MSEPGPMVHLAQELHDAHLVPHHRRLHHDPAGAQGTGRLAVLSHLISPPVQGLTETLWMSPHAFVGFTTVGLCFLQPFLALVRCSPNDSMRPLFNWVHWFIGKTNLQT